MDRRALSVLSAFAIASGCGEEIDEQLIETSAEVVTTLANNTRVSGLGGSRGSMQLFSLAVPEGASGLHFTIAGARGDADLYVRFGAEPTTSAYDFRPYTASSNEDVSPPEARAGTWYIGIHAYSDYSDLSLTVGHQTAGSELALENGLGFTSLGGPKSSEIRLRATVPQGARRLRFAMSGGTGDADLYVRFGQPPTVSAWDHRPYLGTSTETVEIEAPASGEWYAMVRGYTDYSGVQIVATWTGDQRVFEDEVLVLMNIQRAQGATCGGQPYPPAPALHMNETLRNVSRGHSADMAARQFFDHVTPDGRTFDRRMRDGGYAGAGPWGENIAAGQTTPAQVVEGWMNSPGHCVNVMNPAFLVVGVGYFYDPSASYRHYWTEDFGGGD
jgi:uncharacterized protein YkwD